MRTSTVVWLFCSVAFPQSPVIILAGTVKDTAGRPLARAKVQSTCGLTDTSKEGKFELSGPCLGPPPEKVSAYLPGYTVGSAQVVLTQKDIELVLTPNPQSPKLNAPVRTPSEQVQASKKSGASARIALAAPPKITVDAEQSEKDGVTTLSVTTAGPSGSPAGTVRRVTYFVLRSWTFRNPIRNPDRLWQARNRDLAFPVENTVYSVPLDENSPVGSRIDKSVGVLSYDAFDDYVFEVQVEASVEFTNGRKATVATTRFLIKVRGQREDRYLVTSAEHAEEVSACQKEALKIPVSLSNMNRGIADWLASYGKLRPLGVRSGYDAREAILAGSAESLEALLVAGVNPNTVFPDSAAEAERRGNLLVLAAGTMRDSYAVKMLLDKGARFCDGTVSVKAPLPNGDTPFIRAVRSGNIGVLEILLEQAKNAPDPGLCELDVVNKQRESALTLASYLKDLKAVQLLHDYAWNTGLGDGHGEGNWDGFPGTAMVRAVEAGCDNTKIVDELLRYGANPALQPGITHSPSPLGVAAGSGCAQMLTSMLSDDVKLTKAAVKEAWTAAWANQRTEALGILIGSDAARKLIRTEMASSFRYSSRRDDWVLGLLLSLPPSWDDMKPGFLEEAVRNNNALAIGRMLDSGKPYDANANSAFHPWPLLQEAVNFGSPDSVRVLKEHGAVGTAAPGSVRNAILRDDQRIRYLRAALLAGGNPNERIDGEPALMYVASRVYIWIADEPKNADADDLLRLLLEYCADRDVKNEGSPPRGIRDLVSNGHAPVDKIRGERVQLILNFAQPKSCSVAQNRH